MKLKYLYIWLMGLLAIGCFDDDTTVDTVRISEVAIDTNSLQKEYNRDKNQTLVIDITPYVTQKEKNLPLTFQWDMDYKFYSDSSVLYVDCQELGTFPMRVKVSNEHSSAFYEFKLHINSPYEEGIAVLSESNDGTGMLSFVRWQMEAWGILKCVACQRITTELYSRNHPRICRKDYPNYLSVIKMIHLFIW